MGEGGERLFKVVLSGDSGVGKTSLLKRLSEGVFDPRGKPTFGFDCACRSTTLKGNAVKVQIWDSSGDKKFSIKPDRYYPGAAGALLVYDICRHVTFEAAEQTLLEIRQHSGPDVVVVLVGNKLDQRHLRTVSTEEAESFAEKHGLLFFEASALDSNNVEEAYQCCIAAMLKAMETQRKRGVLSDNSSSKNSPPAVNDQETQKAKRRATNCCFR